MLAFDYISIDSFVIWLLGNNLVYTAQLKPWNVAGWLAVIISDFVVT